MLCPTCNQHSHLLQWRNGIYTCHYCEKITSPSCPDVYFRSEYFEPNLANDKNPQGQWIRSKTHKAQIMKELNVRESNDRQHGA